MDPLLFLIKKHNNNNKTVGYNDELAKTEQKRIR